MGCGAGTESGAGHPGFSAPHTDTGVGMFPFPVSGPLVQGTAREKDEACSPEGSGSRMCHLGLSPSSSSLPASPGSPPAALSSETRRVPVSQLMSASLEPPRVMAVWARAKPFSTVPLFSATPLGNSQGSEQGRGCWRNLARLALVLCQDKERLMPRRTEWSGHDKYICQRINPQQES